jgi:hypothetical protein
VNLNIFGGGAYPAVQSSGKLNRNPARLYKQSIFLRERKRENVNTKSPTMVNSLKVRVDGNEKRGEPGRT